MKTFLYVLGTLLLAYGVFYFTVLKETNRFGKATELGRKLYRCAVVSLVVGLLLPIPVYLWPTQEEVKIDYFAESVTESGADTITVKLDIRTSSSLLSNEAIDSQIMQPLLAHMPFSDSSCEINKRRLAMKYYEDQQWDSAALVWSQIANVCQTSADCFYAATAHYFAGDTDIAISYLKHSIKLNPEAPSAYANLGNIMFRLGLVDSSISLFERASTLGKDGISYENLAKAYLAKGDTIGAVHSLRTAVSKDSTLYTAYKKLGYIMSRLDSLELATSYFDSAMGIKPGEPYVLNELGILSYKKGCKQEALKFFREALKADSCYEDPRKNIGLLYYQEYNWEKVDSAFSFMAPDQLSEQEIRALVEAKIEMGKIDEAREIFAARFEPSKRDTSLLLLRARFLLLDSQFDSVSALLKDRELETLYQSRLYMLEVYRNIDGPLSAIEYAKTQHLQHPDELLWSYNVGALYLETKDHFKREQLMDSLMKYWAYFIYHADTSLINHADPDGKRNFLKIKQEMVEMEHRGRTKQDAQ